jgi:L-histidine N-alpha-methyltransferase
MMKQIHEGFTADLRLDEEWISRSLATDIRTGITKTKKSLPPKWFYDELGSELFDKITQLNEYYPTEAEREILNIQAAKIAEISEADHLIELGSGSSDKTRSILDAFASSNQLDSFTAFDVSEEILLSSAEQIKQRYPDVNVRAIVGDFDHHLDAVPQTGKRLFIFLGGTIGNFEPEARQRFLSSLTSQFKTGDSLLLGTDLVKEIPRLELAYNDPDGVTAAFNKNILSVLNKNLGANFDIEKFDHVARFDTDREWIDIGLRSRSDQEIYIERLNLTVNFLENEIMRTEISAKFRPEGIEQELTAAGLKIQNFWTDSANDFAVTLSTLA